MKAETEAVQELEDKRKRLKTDIISLCKNCMKSVKKGNCDICYKREFSSQNSR